MIQTYLAGLKKKSVIALILMITGSVGLDQISKQHSQNTLMVWNHKSDTRQYQGQRHELWSTGSPSYNSKDFYLAFSFNYVRNPGAAWGALQNLPDNVRIPFFYMVTLVAVIIIGVYMKSTPPEHLTARFALSLILSGAIGNFIDRILYGYVIDWIDVRWNLFAWRYDFPNFNIADSAITVGVALLLIDMVILEALRKKRAST